jgi:Endoribonuclease YbeY
MIYIRFRVKTIRGRSCALTFRVPLMSVHTASRQARERNYGMLAELRVLLVHGLLHLLGYDHESSANDLSEVS